MTLGPCARFALCAAVLVGCEGNEPHPRLDAVEPSQAYTDRDLRLTLIGADFVPSFRIDPGSGARVATVDGFSGRIGSDENWKTLRDFGWIGLTQVSAGLPRDDAEDLPVGPCDVEVRDPRGHVALLRGGFDVLGFQKPPVLTVTSPTIGPNYVPGGTIHAIVNAATPPPGHMTALTWTYTEPTAPDGTIRDPVIAACPFLLGAASIDCTFDVTVSSNLNPGITVKLDITAFDDAPQNNQTTSSIPIYLTTPPTVSLVSPPSGGVAGGTNVLIQGSGFVPGSRAYFGTNLLIPDGGILVNRETISGYAPAHVAGTVPVTVQSSLGFASWDQKFEYRLPPQIASVAPSVALPGQTMRVFGARFDGRTIIYLGHNLANAVALANATWINEGEIDGLAPQGKGQATVWAFDLENGWTSLPDGFFWIAP